VFAFNILFCAGISITLQPRSKSFRAESKFLTALTCLATGKSPIYYQWKKYDSLNDSWIEPSYRAMNVTSPELIFSVITEEDEGIYHCIVTSIEGNALSDNATITVFGKESSYSRILNPV